jgi:SARP family transcriptional regulator, regulator of embCAB operon
MGDALTLRLLGRFGLFDDDGPIAVPAGSERLLALLAVDGSTIGRARLAGLLWPRATGRRAQACLRSALRRLPARARAAVSVDIAAVALSETDLRPAALAVLTTEFLPDWYEDWMVTAAEAWRQLRMHGLEALAGHLVAAGRYSEAIEAALAAVSADPMRESARVALIRAHLAEGNRSEAMREFDRYSRLVSAELGLEPTAALHRLLGLPVVRSA